MAARNPLQGFYCELTVAAVEAEIDRKLLEKNICAARVERATNQITMSVLHIGLDIVPGPDEQAELIRRYTDAGWYNVSITKDSGRSECRNPVGPHVFITLGLHDTTWYERNPNAHQRS